LIEKVRLLFVCIENAGRSQMAEAFARQMAPELVEAVSAGSRPAGSVNPVVAEAMREVGCDLGAHRPKSLAEIPSGRYGYVVTMGCGDECPFIPADHHLDWRIPDPKGLPLADVRPIRDQIRAQVEALILVIRKDHV
jgi:arsenate reductase